MVHFSSLPVRRFYILTGTLAMIGMSIGLDATLDLRAGESGILLWIVLLSGLLIVVGAVYGTLTGDPDEYKINGYWLVSLLLAALLSFTSLAGQIARLAG